MLKQEKVWLRNGKEKYPSLRRISRPDGKSGGPFPDTLLSVSDDGEASHNCEQVHQVIGTLMCCQKVIDPVMATHCNNNVRSTQQSCLVRREVGGNDRIWERTGGVVSQSSTSKDQGFSGECS